MDSKTRRERTNTFLYFFSACRFSGGVMKKRSLVSSVVLVILMICQCGSFLGKEVETRTIWESGEGYIRLFKEVGSGKTYQHPFHFHEGDMKRILLSIYYSKHQFFHWSTSSRVFEEDQAGVLSPFFQRAFLDAGPEDLVEFYLPATSQKLLGLSGDTHLTRGCAFVQGDRIHFHFDNIQQKIRSYSTHTEDQEPLPPSGWKLVPQQGQACGREGFSGDPEKADLHWLTIDLNSPLLAAPAAPPAPAALPAAPQDASGPVQKAGGAGTAPAARAPEATPAVKTPAREKLQELKKMMEEGLITPQDYDRKKREILDGF
jgi:hypothetical protein